MSTAPSPLSEPLHRYQLFAALRLLEAAPADQPADAPAFERRLRLRPTPSLGFATTEVVAVTGPAQPAVDAPILVTTNLPGLYGSGSPLPRAYAHEVLLADDEQPQLRAFLDLVHARLFWLWYAGWKRCRYEHSRAPTGDDPLSLALLDLVGLSPQSTVEEIGTPPLRLLRYLSLLLPHPRPASGLAVLLGEELGLAIAIEQGVARACMLPPAQWSRVSVDPDQGGCLGRDLVLGAHRWDRSGELRLHIGPVSAETLDRLLPQGILWRRLVALARYYLQQPLDLRLHVQVPAAQVAPARLGGERPTRLGGPAAAGPVRADPVVFAISAPLSDGVPIARWTRGLAAAGSAASEKTGVSA